LLTGWTFGCAWDKFSVDMIVITEFMDELPVRKLEARYSVHWDPALWSRRAELADLLRTAKALIVRNRTQVDAALLAGAPRLKVIGRLGVGLDNIDVNTAKARGIAVCPATGANANSVAEYVIACTLLLLRGSAFRSTEQLVAGDWPREQAGGGREASGKTLGLVGFGSIGQATAAKAQALGMHVLATDAYLAPSDPGWRGVHRAGIDELLAGADVVSLHVPLTTETRGLMGASAIGRMQPGAILINTARGGIVDAAACAAALRSGHLGGAALDVFDEEPISAEHAGLFAGLGNVLLTPHIAGVTVEANARTSEVTADNVLKVLEQPR
jgi:(S)-sulfolactate dehydrogenase